MTWVALKPIDMGGGETRGLGELLPEAEGWPDPQAWAKTGFIAYVKDGQEVAFLHAVKDGKGPATFAPHTWPVHLEDLALFLRENGIPSHRKGDKPAADKPAHKAEAEADDDAQEAEPEDTRHPRKRAKP